MKRLTQLLIFVGAFLLSAPASQAGFLDKLGLKLSSTNQLVNTLLATNSTLLATNLTQDQVVAGLKEALGEGIQHAVAQIGQTNGFFTNATVKIPMPENLQYVEKTLRSMKAEKLADNFVETMNHAAEQAVPAATAVFVDALKQMSIADAKAILFGADDAATQYFRKVTQTNLVAKFSPIVKKATETNQVTGAYKALMDKVGLAATSGKSSTFGNILSKSSTLLNSSGINFDVDAYVTDKALDGLFKMIAVEEKKIRANPTAQASQLLQQVFGAVKP